MRPVMPARTSSSPVVLSARHPPADRSAFTFADLADAPVVRPDALVSPEAEPFWPAGPRLDGRSAPRACSNI